MRGASDAAAQPDAFDTAHGTDTSGFAGWRALQSGHESDAYNAGYLGVHPDVARLALRRIADPQHYTFLDLGCGKGRALVIAGEFPFKELIGVELNASLAKTAEANLVHMRSSRPALPPARIVCADAAEFDAPAGAFVLFMFHPFEKPVMAHVAERLSETLRANPRPAIVIYVNAKLATLFDAIESLERITVAVPTDAAHAAIWRTRAPAPVLLDPNRVGDR